MSIPLTEEPHIGANGAAGHRMDMVWQYSSPNQVGEAFYLPVWGDYYLPSRRIEGGEVELDETKAKKSLGSKYSIL